MYEIILHSIHFIESQSHAMNPNILQKKKSNYHLQKQHLKLENIMWISTLIKY